MPAKGEAVVVTTAHRGIFFGYLEELNEAQKTIHLSKARNCLFFESSVRGFVGLASSGPSDGCRVGPAAQMTLYDITAVLIASPEAVERWEKAPWMS